MDSKKECQKNSEKCQKFPELVTNFIRSFHFFNYLLTAHSTSEFEVADAVEEYGEVELEVKKVERQNHSESAR